MSKVLLTGSTGFIGHNIASLLHERYEVTSPSRTELDLLDVDTVIQYLKHRYFDAVIHLANPTAQNPIDKYDELFERSLRVFTSLAHCNNLYGKMIYLGSGAEYGKHRAISHVREDEFGHVVPRDPYGLSRYIMSELTRNYNNIVNLRVFGCYGFDDPPFKLIPYIISCIKENKPIELRQNTFFDFLYVQDIAPVLIYFIESKPQYKYYNLCSGESIPIVRIAEEVRRQMKSKVPIVFQHDNFGLDYTGDNSRLRSEIPDWTPRSIKLGIKEIIAYENQKV